MDVLSSVVIFLTGVKDCFAGLWLIKELGILLIKSRPNERREGNVSATSSELLKEVVQCFGLNVFVLCSSVYIFNDLLLPTFRLLTVASSGSYAIWQWLQPAMTFTFSALCVLPLLILDKILNCLWFQDIADLIFEKACGPKKTKRGFICLLGDMICSAILQLLFVLQINLALLFPIPVVREVMWLFHLCLLYSSYAFEYKWFSMGWPLHERLAFIEFNWPYFVGFGLPLALVTDFMMTSYFTRMCVFPVLFPICVISATISTPALGGFKYRPRIFTPVLFVLNAGLRRLVKYVTGVGTERRCPE